LALTSLFLLRHAQPNCTCTAQDGDKADAAPGKGFLGYVLFFLDAKLSVTTTLTPSTAHTSLIQVKEWCEKHQGDAMEEDLADEVDDNPDNWPVLENWDKEFFKQMDMKQLMALIQVGREDDEALQADRMDL